MNSKEVSYLPTVDANAMCWAAREGNVSLLKDLLEAGGDMDARDHNNQTLLHIAIRYGKLDSIKFLLASGANPYLVDQAGKSPVYYAQQFGDEKIIQCFQESNTEVLRRNTRTTSIPAKHETHRYIDDIVQAIQMGNIESVKRLWLESGFQVNQKLYPEQDGRTALHVAVEYGQFQVIELLLVAGASPTIEDQYGNTPITIAQRKGYHEALDLFSAQSSAQSGAIPKAWSCSSLSSLDRPRQYHAQHHHHRHHHPSDNRQHKTSDAMRNLPDLQWAVKFILNAPCQAARETKWIFSEAFRLVEDQCGAILSPHDFGHYSTHHRHLRSFHDIRSQMMIEIGHGLVGQAYSQNQPTWLHKISSMPQSRYFNAPQAKRAGIQTALAIPAIHDDPQLVFCWYSRQHVDQNPQDVAVPLEHLIENVSLLWRLAQEQPSGLQFLKSQFCQRLASALTSGGRLLVPENLEYNVIECCFHWRLFRVIQELATSMSSEDHDIVVPFLVQVFQMFQRHVFGPFDERQAQHESRYHSPQDIQAEIQTTTELWWKLEYFCQYLVQVSPPGPVLDQVHSVLRGLEKPVDKDQEEEHTPEGQAPTCIMCSYQVPGHVHPGQEKQMSRAPKVTMSDSYFGQPLSPMSPILLQIEDVPRQLMEEYESFVALEPEGCFPTCDSEVPTPAILAREVFDSIGLDHQERHESSAITAVLNEILFRTDDTVLLSLEDIQELHASIMGLTTLTSYRTMPAVGYATAQVYRNFLPSSEIPQALERYIHTLRSLTRCPMLCIYVAFAMLVFYIHPFQDGNGRLARLVANVVARKLGYPWIFRAQDKTLQFREFHTKVGEMLIVQASVARQHRRIQVGAKEGGGSRASMWF